MENILKRSLSLFLALVMVFGMVPVNAFAAESDAETETASVMETEAQQAAPSESSEGETEPATEAPTVAATEAATEAVTEAATEESTEAATEAATEETEEATEETTEATEAETEPEITVITVSSDIRDFDLSSDERFGVYLDDKLFGSAMAVSGSRAGAALSGNAALAYSALKPILTDIADGKWESTFISIGDATYGDVDCTVPFTDEVMDEASLKAMLDSVLSALKADMPYELYWLDGNTQVTMQAGVVSDGTGKLAILKFTFPINNKWKNLEKENAVSLTLTGVASTIPGRAQAVVKAAQEDTTVKTDADILRYYKNWICDNVSYDETADSDRYSTNNNPWQIIYVFDDIDTTNVVCEGYAKAFQYLCELTEFEDENFACYTVTGTMSSNGDEGEGHMWNIVHLGGKNYLVDVTNSDEDAIGENGELFLAGATGSVSGGYTFIIDDNNRAVYTYDDNTKNLWDNADLTLAEENYPVPEDTTGSDTMTQDELEEAMNNAASDSYALTGSVTITRNMEIPEEKTLLIGDNASLTVKSGATLTVNGGIHVGSSLTVESDATLVNNKAIYVGGDLTIDGTLQNNSYIQLSNGSLNLNGTYQDDADNSATNSAVGCVFYDWTKAQITGADKIKKLIYEVYVTTESQLRTAVVRQGENEQRVYIAAPMTLSWDLTIPAGVGIRFTNIMCNAVTLTIPEGVTLDHYGSMDIVKNGSLVVNEGGRLNNWNNIWVADGSTLSCEGTFTGNQPYGNGTITIVSPEQVALEKALENIRENHSSDPYQLENSLTLIRDLNANLSWEGGACTFVIPQGVTLTVPSGVTLTTGSLFNYGTIDVQSGGKLIIEDFFYLRGTLNSSDAITFGKNGNIILDEAYAYALNATVAKTNLAMTYHLNNDSISQLNTLLKKSGYGHYFIEVETDLTISDNVTIPADKEINMGYGSVLVINKGKTLTNNGQLYFLNYNVLENNGTIKNNGFIFGNPMRIGDGKITGTGETNLFNPDYQTMSQEDFLSAIANGGFVELGNNLSVEISWDMTIPDGTIVWMNAGSSITVKSGVTLTVNGQLTANSSTITVEDGATLVNNSVVSLGHGSKKYGAITINGTLENNDCIIVGSGTLNLNGTYAEKTDEYGDYVGYVSFDWLHASITGSDKIHNLVYATVVTTEAELQSAVIRKTGDQFVDIQGFITLTKNLTIPQGVTLGTGYSYDSNGDPYQNGLTIEKNVTLTNKGSLNVVTASKVEILSGGTLDNQGSVLIADGNLLTGAGTYKGYAPLVYEGGVFDMVGVTPDTLDYWQLLREKQAAENEEEGQSYYLDQQVTLKGDFDTSLGAGDFHLEEGGKIIVPAGCTLTVYSPLYVHSGATIEVQSGGKLFISGALIVEDGGMVLIKKGGSYELADEEWAGLDGAIANENQTEVFLYGTWLECDDDGWYLPEDREIIFIDGVTATQEQWMIFFARTYDFQTNQWVDTPVVPKVAGTGQYTIKKISSLKDQTVQDGETYGNYFVKICSTGTLGEREDQIKVTYGGKDYTLPFTFYALPFGAYTTDTPSADSVITDGNFEFSADNNVFYLLPLDGYTVNDISPDYYTYGEDYKQYSGNQDFVTLDKLENGGWKVTINPNFVDYTQYDWKNFCMNWKVELTNSDGNIETPEGGIWCSPADNSMLETVASIGINGSYYHIYETGKIAWDCYDAETDQWNRTMVMSLPNGVSYDYKTNTMTLTNASLEELNIGYGYEDEGRSMPSRNFTLKLVGENTLVNSTTAPVNAGNLNITIAGEGSLTILAHNSLKNENAFSAMQLFDGCNLTIQDSAKVSICNDGEGHYYNEEDDTYFNADLHCINGGDQKGTLTLKDSATLTTRVPDGEYVFKNVNGEGMRYHVICSMNILVQDKATLNTDSIFLFDGETFTQKGGTVNIEAPKSYSAYSNDEGGMDVWTPYEGIYACKGSTINLSGGEMNISQPSDTDHDGIFYGIQVTDEGTGNGATLNITGGTLNITGDAQDGVGIKVATCSQMNMSGGEVNVKNDYAVKNSDYWTSITVFDPNDGDNTNGVLNLSGGTINAENFVWAFELNMTGGQFNLQNNENIVLSEEDQANNVDNDLLHARMYVTCGSISGGEINITNGTLVNQNNFGMDGGNITIDNTGMIEVTGLENYTYFPVNAGTLDIHTNGFCAIVNNGIFHQMGGVVKATTDNIADVIYNSNQILVNDGEMTITGDNGVHQTINLDRAAEEEDYAPVFAVNGGNVTINAKHIGIRNKSTVEVTELNGKQGKLTINIADGENAVCAINSEYYYDEDDNRLCNPKLILNAGELTANHNIEAHVLEMNGGKLTMSGDNNVQLELDEGSISGGEINITNGTLINRMNFSIDGGEITIDNTTGSTEHNLISCLVNNTYLPINGGTLTLKTRECAAIVNNGTFHQMGGIVTAETINTPAMLSYNCLLLNNGTLNLKGDVGIHAANDEDFTDSNKAVVQVLGGELNIEAIQSGIHGELPIDLGHDTKLADSACVNITVTSKQGAGMFTEDEMIIHSDVELNIDSQGMGICGDNARITVEDTPKVSIKGADGSAMLNRTGSEEESGFTFNNVELTTEDDEPLTIESNGTDHYVNSHTLRIKASGDTTTVTSWEELQKVMKPVKDENGNLQYWQLYQSVEIAGSFAIEEPVNVMYGQITIHNNKTLTVASGVEVYLYNKTHISVEKGGTLTIAKGGYLSFQGQSMLDVVKGATLVNNGELSLHQNIGMPYEGTGYTHVYGTYSQDKKAYTYANVHSSAAVEGNIPASKIILNAFVYPGGEDVLDMFLERYSKYKYANSYANLFGYTIDRNITIPKGVTLYCADGTLTIDEGVKVTVNGELRVDEMYGVPMELNNLGEIVINKGGILSVTGNYASEGKITNNGGKILPAATKVTITKADAVSTYDISDEDLTAKLNVVLTNSNLSQVKWTSSNSKIVDATKITERDEDGNWIVPFARKAVGKVTLTATAIDGGKASAKITLNTSFINDGKLTATLTDTAVAGSLQPGETGQLVFKCGDEQLDMEQLTFKVAKTGIVELDKETGEVMGILNKASSVKITATLKDDPKKRSVTITVKTIVPQVMGIALSTVTEDDLNNLETDKTGSRNYTIKAEFDYDDAVKTWAEENGVTLPAPSKSNIKWSTTDAKVAKITANSNGTATVTIPKNADGAAAITATANDSYKQHTTMEIAVKNYTPKLRNSTVTINSKLTYDWKWLELLESYGNEITEVEVRDTKGAQNNQYITRYNREEDRWEIRLDGDKSLKNGTYKVKLLVKSVEHPNGDYLDLTITVKNSTPKITVEQHGKFNLFYTTSELPISVTADGEKITSLAVTAGSNFSITQTSEQFEQYPTDQAEGTIEYSSEYLAAGANGKYSKVNTKLTVWVELEGYRDPISTTITVKTETVKPTLELWNNNLSYNTALGDVVNPIEITVKNSTTDMFINLSQELRSISLSSTNGAKLDKEQFEIYYQKTPTKSGTNKITLQCKNWTQSMTLTQKITISTSKPTAKLSAATVTMNRNYPSYIMSTGISCSEKITSVKFEENSKSSNFILFYDAGPIGVMFINGVDENGDPNPPAAGKYTVKVTPYVRGTEEVGTGVALKTLTLTINVVNTKPTVKASSTMTLNTNFTAHVASTTLTTNQTGVNVVGITDEDNQFKATGKNATEGAKISVWYDAESGEVKAELDPDNLPKTGTYTFQATPIAQYTGNSNSSEDNIGDLSAVTVTVKVESTKPTVSLSATELKLNTYYVHDTEDGVNSEIGTAKVTLTNKTAVKDVNLLGFRVGETEIMAGSGEYVDEHVSLSFDGTAIIAKLTSNEVVKKGISYTLYPMVSYKQDPQPVTLSTVTLKVTPYKGTPAVTLSASGKLDTLNRDVGITYTVNSISNAIGEIYKVELLDAETGEESDLFDVKLGEKNAKGKQTFTLKLDPEQDYKVKTYKVKFRYTIAGTEVTSGTVSVKVTQSALTLKVTANPFYQSTGEVSFQLNHTAPVTSRIDYIELNHSKTSREFIAAFGDLIDEVYDKWNYGEGEWDYTPGVHTFIMSYDVENPGRLTAGKSYNLYFDVYPVGGAKDKPTTIKVTVKVSK